MLDGYTLDIGYHAISANGAATCWTRRPDRRAPGGGEARRHVRGTTSRERSTATCRNLCRPAAQKIGKEMKIPFLSFYNEAYGLPEEEIDRLEKVSFQEWAEGKGITKSDSSSTTSTPWAPSSRRSTTEGISMGDIFRYFKHAFVQADAERPGFLSAGSSQRHDGDGPRPSLRSSRGSVARSFTSPGSWRSRWTMPR